MGRFSKKKEQSQEEEFRKAYAAANAEQRAEIDALFRYSQQYTSADPLNNHDARQYAEQMYKNAIAYLNGTYTGEMSPIASTKSIFGNYTHPENINNANALTYLYFNSPYEGEDSGSSAYIQSDFGNNLGQYVWDPNKSITRERLLAMYPDFEKRTDKEDLLKKELNDILYKNLQELNTKYLDPDHWNVRGFTPGKDAVAGYLSKFSPNAPKLTREALASLAMEIGVKPEVLQKYFANPETTTTETTTTDDNSIHAQMLKAGFKDVELTNETLKNRGYHLMKDPNSGELYIFDANWRPITEGGEMNLNYMDPNQYGRGYVIVKDGNYGKYYDYDGGDLHDLLNDVNHPHYASDDPYKKAVNDLITKYKENQDEHFTEFSDIAAPYDIEGNESIEAFRDALNKAAANGYKNWADVSYYFGEPAGTVLAVNKNAFNKTSEGLLDLRGTELLYKNSETGQILQTPYNAENPLSGLFSVQGRSNYTPYSRTDISIPDLKTEANQNSYEIPQGSWYEFRNFKVPLINDDGSVNGHIFVDDIGSNADKNIAVKAILYLAQTPNTAYQALYDEIIADLLDNPEHAYSLKIALQQFLQNHYSTPFWKNGYIKFVNDLKTKSAQFTNTPSNKKGGILYAKQGASSPAQKQQNTDDNLSRAIEKSKKEGTNVTKALQSNESFEWGELSTSDYLRASALLLDLGQLIGAATGLATGGAGNAAAAAMGITSTGVDLAADALDPTLTWGDMLKNGAINLGLGLGASIIPGLKTTKFFPKLGKLLLKLAPIGVSAVDLAEDPDMTSLYTKIKDGNYDFTKGEMMAAYRSLKTVLSLGSAGLSAKQSTGKVKAVAASAVKSEVQTGKHYILGSNGKPLVDSNNNPYLLTTEQAKKFNDLSRDNKKGKNKDAIETLLREVGVDESQFGSLKGSTLIKSGTSSVKEGDVSQVDFDAMRKAVDDYAHSGGWRRGWTKLDELGLKMYGGLPWIGYWMPGSKGTSLREWDPVNKKWLNSNTIVSPVVQNFETIFRPINKGITPKPKASVPETTTPPTSSGTGSHMD